MQILREGHLRSSGTDKDTPVFPTRCSAHHTDPVTFYNQDLVRKCRVHSGYALHLDRNDRIDHEDIAGTYF
ncbi:hypothetical protein D3C74_458880 [compost metagenome]